MSRIFGTPNGETPKIDRTTVESFFEQRAQKSSVVGSISTVIYQDKNPELAIMRDTAEKKLLLGKIDLSSGMRVLDLGCGNGRWTPEIIAAQCEYVGVDQSPSLIALAKEYFQDSPNVKFAVCPAEAVTLDKIAETEPFARILCFGVLIYLNDEDVAELAGKLPGLAAKSCRIILREPIGLEERLTIQDHHSSDMDQIYNAIYRTEAELIQILTDALSGHGFRFEGSGDVYESNLNNRAETRQRWFIFER